MSVDNSDETAAAATDPEQKRRSRVEIIPILALLVALAAGIALLFQGLSNSLSTPQTPAAGPMVTRVIATDPATGELIDTPGDGFGVVPGLATPWAVAGGPGEAAATAVPSVEPEAIDVPEVEIGLLGPPPDSLFRMSDVVSFYWSGPDQPITTGRFFVSILDGTEQIAVGDITSPNLGENFALQVNIGQIVGEAGEYEWLIVMEDEATGEIIGASETRRLVLLADN